MDVILSILNGQEDERLDNIAEAIRQRKRAVALSRAATLKPGDKVRITGGISPKYLIGLVGEVAGPPQGDRIPVKLGPEAGRYSGTARTPISCVEPVAA